MTANRALAALACLTLLLAGCSGAGIFAPRDRAPQTEVAEPEADTTRPEVRPAAAIRPPTGARTAEAFDTTTAAERVAAVAPPPAALRDLGRTTVSLGDPAEPGFWLRTSLVDSVRRGRVTHEPSGASVALELRPSGGSGSQLSLAAFRALGLSLTALPELLVQTE